MFIQWCGSSTLETQTQAVGGRWYLNSDLQKLNATMMVLCSNRCRLALPLALARTLSSPTPARSRSRSPSAASQASSSNDRAPPPLLSCVVVLQRMRPDAFLIFGRCSRRFFFDEWLELPQQARPLRVHHQPLKRLFMPSPRRLQEKHAAFVSAFPMFVPSLSW